MIQLKRILYYLFNLFLIVNTFNFSPKPNLKFYEPELRKSYLPKVRSSYFGYAINLRTSSLFVGAPRAQSNQELQRKVNETGAIYKCSLINGLCSPYIFDKYGNRQFEYNDYTWNSEKKDYQWLGATIDGGSRDNERLIVCAPRLCADATHEYLMHGICYWTPDTLSDQPQNIKTIAPLRLKTLQVRETPNENPNLPSKKSFYYMFGEQGLSLHWTDINEEIIIGAPGIHTWKGSVIRYKPLETIDIGGISKRDTMGVRVSRQNDMEFVSEVPNPELWDQPNDSYFGYSVSSGTFDDKNASKLLYVASAPQAGKQSGEVYIFDIETKKHNQFTIRKHQTFHGDQFGEFFGYLVTSEDINKDGLTDLLISAPLHSVGLNYDKGAVYVFINKGNFNFEKQIIVSPSQEPGRFGTAISKLGDINHDGFNDVAIGAPFDNGGTVFIYLGTHNGLRDKASQILKGLDKDNEQTVNNHMFGHGMSKGVDIDQNGFSDFAVGAPNSDVVYLYKTYPVVKILASISSPSREIKMDQTKFQIRACFLLETTSSQISSQNINVQIKADLQGKRVKFSNANNEIEFSTKATLIEQCKLYDADVKFIQKDIFKPIELEMHYELSEKIPDSEIFCDTCAAVDPADSNMSRQKIIFSTGCKNQVCVADLRLSSLNSGSSFVIGSSRTLSVDYEIVNMGETAYLPQLNVTSSNKMPFAKIPSNCDQTDHVLVCDLKSGQPMYNSDKETLRIIFDTSELDGKSMTIIAEAFSTGKELNSKNNILANVIELKEYSIIEAIGSSNKAIISLEEKSGFMQFINNYEIKNLGPSKVDEMEIMLNIPVSYIIPNSNYRIPLIAFNNISVKAEFASYKLKVEYYQNNSLIVPEDITSTPDPTFSTFSDNDILDQKNEGVSGILYRRKRSLEQRVAEAEYAGISERKVAKSLSEELVGTLPINRTISFNCNDPEETLCIQAIVRFFNFKSNDNEQISISLTYKIDLDEVNKILVNDKEFFVITTALNIVKIGDEIGDSIKIVKSTPHNIISKHQLHSTPFWVIILAILAGILVLALLSYGLYKLGFFKRATKEEMANLTKESETKSDSETE